jgi:mannose-6-phosphate isomerase-like protein (cupin superfamily)
VDNFLKLENRHTGEILRIRRVGDAAGQIVLKIDGSLPARASGPPVHVHFHEREEWSVKAGTLGARVGNEKIVVTAGGSVVFPAGVIHSWWNAGDDLLEFSGRAIPAVDLDRYLQALFAVLNAKPIRQAVDLLPGPRVVATQAHPGGQGASARPSADRFPAGSAGRPPSGQIPRR